MAEHLKATPKRMPGEKKLSVAEPAYEKPAGDPVLGAIIRAGRKAKDMTQEQLAEAVQATKSAVSQWEKGTNHIKDENRRALAVALDIPLEVMFRVSEGAVHLSPAERLLIERYRRLRPDTQKAFLLILASYGTSEPPQGN